MNILFFSIIFLLNMSLTISWSSNSGYINQDAEVSVLIFDDDGIFPNNVLPVIIYKQVINFSEEHDPQIIETIFQDNGWGNSWRNGVYSFHHYHSTAHEVLGVYSGSAKIQLGGPGGIECSVKKGDVVLIPAGIAHKNNGSSSDFKVVGAYPKGQSWDMNYGKKEERPDADNNIKKVSLPDKDPVFGNDGPVSKKW